MKTVIVVGLGSMGCRRIRLLKEIDASIQIGGIDTQQSRRDAAKAQYGIDVFSSIQEAVSALNPFAGIVCTSPLSHRAIILELLDFKMHVFTEINLISDGYDEMISKAKKAGVMLFLSSTFLYRKDVQYIIRRAKQGPVNYCIHTGQYLPDWHPWEDYQSFFVGNKRTNGCREIFAIDLPWILKAFGDVSEIHVSSGRLSKLNIDYPDNYIVNLVHKNGSKGVFFCDIVSRNGGRRAELFRETLHLIWNGTPDSLFEYNIDTKKMEKIDTYHEQTQHLNAYLNSSIVENAYKDELTTFLASLEHKAVPRYTFEEDEKTIALIDRIEGSL